MTTLNARPEAITFAPQQSALIVVLATAVLMLGAIDFGTRAPARAMIFLGDISYSLYLAHWPLFAVANHVYAEAVPIPVKALLCAAALILATLSWRFVEQPFRTAHGMARQRTFLLASGAGATLLLAALLPHALRPAAPGPVQPAFSPTYGLDRACAADKTRDVCADGARQKHNILRQVTKMPAKHVSLILI